MNKRYLQIFGRVIVGFAEGVWWLVITVLLCGAVTALSVLFAMLWPWTGYAVAAIVAVFLVLCLVTWAIWYSERRKLPSERGGE